MGELTGVRSEKLKYLRWIDQTRLSGDGNADWRGVRWKRALCNIQWWCFALLKDHLLRDYHSSLTLYEHFWK